MKKKFIIPMAVLMALGTAGALSACQKDDTPVESSESSQQADSSSTSSKEDAVLTDMKITNLDALTAAFEKGDDDRAIALSCEPEINVTTYVNKGLIKITSSNTEAVVVLGRNIRAVGNGTATITVEYKNGTTTITKQFDVTATIPTPVKINTIRIGNASTSGTVTIGTYAVKGVVTVVTSNGFMLDDGTGAILVYGVAASGLNLSEGDYAFLKGTVQAYNGLLEFTSMRKVEDLDKTQAPTTTLANADKIKSYMTTDGNSAYNSDNDKASKIADFTPVEFWATTYLSSTYKAWKVNDLGSHIVEPVNYSGSKIKDGAVVKVKGYYVYGSSYGKLYVSDTYVETFELKAESFTIAAANTPYVVGSGENLATVSATMEITTEPVNATNREVTWSIAEDDADKATIDANGILTPKARGTVTVNAVYKADTTKTATAEVEIKSAGSTVKSLKLNNTTVTDVWAGVNQTLTSSVEFDDTSIEDSLDAVTFTSSDESIATVTYVKDSFTKATVVGKKAGTVTITATTINHNSSGQPLTATCTYTFKEVKKATEATKYAKVNTEGVVVAKWSSSKNFLIDDGETGVFWAYSSSANEAIDVGDSVSLTGSMITYNNAYEVSSAALNKLNKTITAHTATAVAKTADDLNNLETSGIRAPATEKWAISNVPAVASGDYVNLKFGDNAYTTYASSGVTLVGGKTYNVEGYHLGYKYDSKAKKVTARYFVCTAATEVTASAAA